MDKAGSIKWTGLFCFIQKAGAESNELCVTTGEIYFTIPFSSSTYI